MTEAVWAIVGMAVAALLVWGVGMYILTVIFTRAGRANSFTLGVLLLVWTGGAASITTYLLTKTYLCGG